MINKRLAVLPAATVGILLSMAMWNAPTGGSDGTSSSDVFSQPLSGALPYDVDPTKVRTLVDNKNVLAAHREFDNLAWKAFIALNWPALANGQPSDKLTISETATPRVWEFWRPSDSIFLDDGAQPTPWIDKVQQSIAYYWKSAWRQHTTAASNLEAFSGPLVDQNGNWVRYQIRVNKEEFDYIFKNELYSQDGQIKFSHREKDNQVELPVNDGTTKHGAIEIKLAWKELTAKDDASRFFTRDIVAAVSEPPESTGKPVLPKSFKAGLVGMHISMRTQSSPEWIWATFEQVDNTRENKYPDGKLTRPSFYNPTKSIAVNQLAPANAVQDPDTGVLKAEPDSSKATHWIESLTKTPVQVARIDIPTQAGLNPLDAKLRQVTAAINMQAQKALAHEHSVFQYYELIDSQWPVHPNALAYAGGAGSAPESIKNKTPGDMVPVFLVNTIMETYFQKGAQAAGNLEQDDRLVSTAPAIDATPVNGSESCVGCHYSAGITQSYKTDLETGLEVVDKNGVPKPVFGENNHFGKTGNSSFSWMLQLEPKARRKDIHDPSVIVKQ